MTTDLESRLVLADFLLHHFPFQVNEMLHCYTISANCTMFHEASEPGNFPWRGEHLFQISEKRQWLWVGAMAILKIKSEVHHNLSG